MSDGRSKTSWLPGTATVLAVLSCYGTTVLIGLLSLLGISLALDERAWSGAISFFAVLATIAIALSYRRHRVVGPIAFGAIGLGLVLWVMYSAYSRVLKLVGFAFLVAATLWDWGARSRRRTTAHDLSWIQAPELAAQLRRIPAPLIVDLRGPEEFSGELGHIRGARNVPLAELSDRVAELSGFREHALALVCRTQIRSVKAAGMLRSAGFRNVTILRGGMEEWNRHGFEIAHHDKPELKRQPHNENPLHSQ